MSEKYFVEEDVFTVLEDESLFDDANIEIAESKDEPNTDMPTAAQSYIKAINAQCPVRLSPEESIELGRIMKTGSEKEAQKARTKLVEGHLVFALKYVLRVYKASARSGQSAGIPLEDLIQSANMGLMKAVDKYDYTHGVAFSTYCRRYLTKEVTMYLANATRQISLSEHHKRYLSQVGRYTQAHPEHIDNPKAIAEALGYSEAVVTEWLRIRDMGIQLSRESSLDITQGGHEFVHNADIRGSSDNSFDRALSMNSQELSEAPDESYIQKERTAMLRKLLDDNVNKLERNVILLRCCMETQYNGVELSTKTDGTPTFEEIGAVIGCGKTRAWQAFNSGIKKLRAVADPELLM